MRTNVRKFRLALTTLTLVALLLAVFGAVSVWADTHYVDPAGSNVSPYTTSSEAAHRIQDAIDAANSGDVVDVAAGTYAENVTIPAGKDNLKLIGAGSDTTTISITSGAAIETGSPITVEGFSIQGPGRPGDGIPKTTAFKFRPPGSDGEPTSGTVENPGVFKDNKVTGVNYGVQSGDWHIHHWEFVGNDFSELRIGIGLEDMDHVKVIGNTFADYKEGVSMGWDADTAHHVEIRDNEFLGDFIGRTDNLAAIVISSAAIDITVTGNEITNSVVGVLIKVKDEASNAGHEDGLDTVHINNNNIYGNDMGVVSEAFIETISVDATCNWWGDLDPSDQVSGDVDYCPWLDAAFPGGSTTYPVANANTGTGYCSIQAAIDAASLGDTINVAAGTYDEYLVIQKSVHLIGEDKNTTILTYTGTTKVEQLIMLGWNKGGTLAGGATVQGFNLLADEGLYGDKDLIKLRANGVSGSQIVIKDNIFQGDGATRYLGIETAYDAGYVKVDNNEFYDLAYGAYFNVLTNAEISNNTFSNGTTGAIGMGGSDLGPLVFHNVSVVGNTMDGGKYGLVLAQNLHGISFLCNRITNNSHTGVLLWEYGPVDWVDVYLNYNNIVGNAVGMQGYDNPEGNPAIIVDAINNWWGNASGPGGNGSGSGDLVLLTNVLFTPWLTEEIGDICPPPAVIEMASFAIDHAKFDCKKEDNDGKVHVKGELELATTRNISEDVVVTVGSWSCIINMEEKGKEGEHWEYKRPKDGDGFLKHMKLDWNKGTFDFEMDGLDLSGVNRPVNVSVQIGDDFGQATVLTSKITEVTIDSGKKEDGAKVHVKGELGFGYICGPYPSPTNGDIIEVSVEQGTTEFGPWTIDGGNIELKGKEGESWEYKPDKNSDTVFKHAKVDWKKGTFDFDLDGVDLGSLDPAKPVQVSVTIEGETISQTVSLTAKGKKDQWKTQAIADQVRVVMSPNPIRDVHTARFQVMGTLATQVEEIRVQIYDLSGRLVWEDTAPGSELDWHTDNQSGQFLANGVYLYQVQVKIDGIWINQDIGKIAVLR